MKDGKLDDEKIELPRLKDTPKKPVKKDIRITPANKSPINTSSQKTKIEFAKKIETNQLPEKKVKKKKLVLKKKFIVIFLIVFASLGIYSSFNIVRWAIDAKNTKKQIEEIQEVIKVEEVIDSENVEVVNPPEEEVNEENPYWDFIKMNLINVDFKDLKAKNSDTVGWLQVGGTNINYPFVQTTDNTYYLKKNFNKKYSSAGWVFMDYRNNLQNLDQNTIIYAHGRIDGTMFGSLKNVTENSWYNDTNNHIVKVSTEYQNTLWQVFSVYIIPKTSDYLETNFNDNEKYIEFLNMLKERSKYNFDVTLNESDKILTLSTCYKQNDRVVLHAKLIKMEDKNGNN